MSDSRLQEIMTRAVVGRAERTLTWCHKLAANDMTQVLGVRIGKTAVSVASDEGQPLAELTVDCDLWCSGGEETKVIRTRCRCLQEVSVPLRGEVLGEVEHSLQLISGPRSSGVRVEGQSIYIDFEATVQVEVTALARIWLKVYEMDLSSDPYETDLSLSGESNSPYGSH